jgi:hypothetical protein
MPGQEPQRLGALRPAEIPSRPRPRKRRPRPARASGPARWGYSTAVHLEKPYTVEVSHDRERDVIQLEIPARLVPLLVDGDDEGRDEIAAREGVRRVLEEAKRITRRGP